MKIKTTFTTQAPRHQERLSIDFKKKEFLDFIFNWCAASLKKRLMRAVLPRMIRIRIMNQGCLGALVVKTFCFKTFL